MVWARSNFHAKTFRAAGETLGLAEQDRERKTREHLFGAGAVALGPTRSVTIVRLAADSLENGQVSLIAQFVLGNVSAMCCAVCRNSNLPR